MYRNVIFFSRTTHFGLDSPQKERHFSKIRRSVLQAQVLYQRPYTFLHLFPLSFSKATRDSDGLPLVVNLH